MWNIITMRLCPGAMGIRHFIPFFFVLSVIGLGVLGFLHSVFWALLGAELTLYLLLDIYFSVKKSSCIKEFFALLILFPIFHVSYGVGSLIGIIKLFSKEFRGKKHINKKI